MAIATDERSVLDRAAEVLAELAALDLDALRDDELSETVLAFQRLRGALESAEARVLARWDARRVWRIDGAKTAAAWLAGEQRLPIQTARQRVRHARAMRMLPEVECAWSAGEIDRTHLITLLGARTPRTRDAFETDHKVLLDAARTMGFADFKRRCDVWEALVDPDGAEQGAESDREARELHLSQSFGGMWFGRMTLDPISGEIVQRTLSLIERELFDADWAEAKQRLDRAPMVFDLRRTPAQRRADALVEMATRARTAPAGGRRPAPLFSVLVGYETLAGPTLELFNRTVLTPGTAARWLSEADVERIVFDTPSRVIDVGAQRRFFRGALRRAIEVRDRTCFHPLCDEIPDRLEIDHIHEAAKGGETTQVNGRGGCHFHNWHRLHHPEWDAAIDRASPQPNDPDVGPDPPE
ncbi:MAG: DUF222 domain-containing protein [Acidimicrobiales bacterium]